LLTACAGQQATPDVSIQPPRPAPQPPSDAAIAAGLTETANGLEPEEKQAKRFAPGFFTAIEDWLGSYHLVRRSA
jgi:hypothetical protein